MRSSRSIYKQDQQETAHQKCRYYPRRKAELLMRRISVHHIQSPEAERQQGRREATLSQITEANDETDRNMLRSLLHRAKIL
jgi:hypothetical protein